MWWYGSKTPKRTILWSSSPSIGHFWTRKLRMVEYKKKVKEDPNPVQPVKKYRDREGRQRFQGTCHLKPTEPGSRWSPAKCWRFFWEGGKVFLSVYFLFGSLVIWCFSSTGQNQLKALQRWFWWENCWPTERLEAELPLRKPFQFSGCEEVVYRMELGWPLGRCPNEVSSSVFVWCQIFEGASGVEGFAPKRTVNDVFFVAYFFQSEIVCIVLLYLSYFTMKNSAYRLRCLKGFGMFWGHFFH